MKLWLPRALAILIAIAAVVDPAVTSDRRVRPEVSVIAAHPGRPVDRSRADDLAQRLARNYTVLRAPFAGASATVVAGGSIPASISGVGGPVFAVLPDRVSPSVDIESVSSPASALLDARVPVTLVVHVRGVGGSTVDVALEAKGLTVYRATRNVATNDERLRIELSFVPAAVGPAALRITVSVAGMDRSARTDLAIDVQEERWAVLFHDARPSWMSTFVRRAIEQDARFVVSSRISTSRGISAETNRPPRALDDRAALELYDAVVIGAPEALTEGDVANLEAFMRRRGGGVVLLMDHRVAGPYERLARVARWSDGERSEPIAIALVEADSVSLRASGVIWPTALPVGGVALASSAVGSGALAGGAVVWSAPAGAGRLVVSGALDAWRFRDPAVSSFNEAWRRIIADVAASAMPPIDIALSSRMVPPGGTARVVVTVRDAMLSDVVRAGGVQTTVSATLEGLNTAIPVRLLPDGPIGRFRAAFRVPDSTGVYRLVVSGDAARAEAPLLVAESVSVAAPDEPALLAAWAAARGGGVLESSPERSLEAALETALRPAVRRTTWHPMRSAWWILPFALLLGIEWWFRRQRGLA